MSQQLVKIKETPSLAFLPALPPDQAERQVVVAKRINDLQLSSPASLIVLAQLAGTRILEADELRLELMWLQIVKLLEIKIEGSDEEWEEHLVTLNDWVKREYGNSLTCEELELAYNALVKEELRKDDGRLLEAFPVLNARHVGEVLAAYRRRNARNNEVNEVLSTGAYLPAPVEPTTADIDAIMEIRLQEAIDATKRGINYFDLGNGIYTWLFKKGRIRPSAKEWEESLILGKARVRASLANQQETIAKLSGFGIFRPKKKANLDGQQGFQPLRSVIKKRLADVINEEGDFVKLVRQEAFRICLANWLRTKAGVTEEIPYHLPTTPNLKPDEYTGPKPFSHTEYVKKLILDLPLYTDEQVSDLQLRARKMNVLDVYEIATDEWAKRTATNQQSARKHGKKQ